MDQPGKVANPARGQLNRENNIPLSLCVPENLVYKYNHIEQNRYYPVEPMRLTLGYPLNAMKSLKKNENAPRPSEHPPVRGKPYIQCSHLNLLNNFPPEGGCSEGFRSVQI